MKLQVLKGTTSKILSIFVMDNSVTTGAGLTGLAYNTSGLTAAYAREGVGGGATTINLVNATQGTYTSSGFIVKDATKQPGVYELHIPDAALASGANSVIAYLKGAANMAPVVLEIELDDPTTASVSGTVTVSSVQSGAVSSIQSGMATYAQVVSVQADTDDIQSRLPSTLYNGQMWSFSNGIADGAIKAATIASNAITAASIATDAIDDDALAASAITEIWAKAMQDLSAVPAAGASVLDAVNWMFELMRNKRTQTATTETVMKDDGTTTLATAAKSDDGSVFTRSEYS